GNLRHNVGSASGLFDQLWNGNGQRNHARHTGADKPRDSGRVWSPAADSPPETRYCEPLTHSNAHKRIYLAEASGFKVHWHLYSQNPKGPPNICIFMLHLCACPEIM